MKVINNINVVFFASMSVIVCVFLTKFSQIFSKKINFLRRLIVNKSMKKNSKKHSEPTKGGPMGL